MSLTEISVRNAKAPETGQMTLWDAVPGFGLRVSQGGTKSWIVLLGRQRRRVTIGRYPIISLADARSEAKRLLAEHTLGKHRPHTVAFHVALTEYKKGHLDNLASGHETHRQIELYFLPKFRHTKLEELSPAEVAQAVDKVKTASARSHAFGALRGFLRWAYRRNYLSRSPMEAMKPPTVPPSRSRVLSLEELALIYQKAGDGHVGKIVKLLILTGQRRGEIASLRGEYIDHDAKTIELPRTTTKNRHTHVFPFGDLGAELLKDVPKQGLLFPARGRDNTPFNGWSKSKPEVGFDDWTLHDLRRSFATHLAEMGVLPHVIERLLNHVSGSLSPIALVYNRAKYLAEMREAVGLWEKRLHAILAAA